MFELLVGLDLVPEATPRPGYEAEWRKLIAKDFSGREVLTDADVARFEEISVPPYATIGAPRVGFDAAADAWLEKQHKPESPSQLAELIEKHRGYYVVSLVGPPAVPGYSNGLTGYVDETSSRGSWLDDCKHLLAPKGLFDRTRENLWPEDAVAYGKALLAVAQETEQTPPPLRPMPMLMSRLFGRKPRQPSIGDDEAIDILRAAGNWYVFWGERGHPIKAWC